MQRVFKTLDGEQKSRLGPLFMYNLICDDAAQKFNDINYNELLFKCVCTIMSIRNMFWETQFTVRMPTLYIVLIYFVCALCCFNFFIFFIIFNYVRCSGGRVVVEANLRPSDIAWFGYFFTPTTAME